MTGNPTELSKKDFTSDQEVRWCPGCGDYAILATIQSLLPDLGATPESTVFVSGIGCAARFPYYMDTYGIHSIHGRAPALATGLAVARPDLDVWVVGGDGDMLSIGGNHLIHAMRRNVNMTLLLFNNEIYGLTKGQYSPTSRVGTVAKSTPEGSIDRPVNPISLALGAEATFVARTIDNDRNHLSQVLEAAHRHEGAALVEIFQNCIVFNDDVFLPVRDRQQGAINRIELSAGEPLTFGPDDERCVVRDGAGMAVVPTDSVDPEQVVVHDPTLDDPSQAFALSRIGESGAHGATPMGIFRAVDKPVYGVEVAAQQAAVRTRKQPDLSALLASGSTWEVEEGGSG